MLESEWLLEKISSNVQVPFFSKDVGILKDPREKWPCAVKWLAPGSTEGWVRPDPQLELRPRETSSLF